MHGKLNLFPAENSKFDERVIGLYCWHSVFNFNRNFIRLTLLRWCVDNALEQCQWWLFVISFDGSGARKKRRRIVPIWFRRRLLSCLFSVFSRSAQYTCLHVHSCRVSTLFIFVRWQCQHIERVAEDHANDIQTGAPGHIERCRAASIQFNYKCQSKNGQFVVTSLPYPLITRIGCICHRVFRTRICCILLHKPNAGFRSIFSLYFKRFCFNALGSVVLSHIRWT